MTAYQGKAQYRRDTSANWASNNPTLASGELGYDTDLKRFKFGDGVSTWLQLAWVNEMPHTLPPNTGWTAFQSATVLNDSNGRYFALAASAGTNIRGELRTLSPAINYTARYYFDFHVYPIFNYFDAGIILKHNAAGTIIKFELVTDTGVSSGLQLRCAVYSNYTSFSSVIGGAAPTYALSGGIPRWLQVRDDGTNRFYEFSYNGFDWQIFFQHARTASLASPPDLIGWGMSANSSGGAYNAIGRLRSFSGVA